MHTLALLVLPALFPQAADPPRPPAPPGRRADLTDGKLFVPDGFTAPADGIELLLHLHGGTAAEKQLVRSGRSAVVVSVAIPGLSSVYTARFKDPKTFARILDETAAKLKELGVTAEAPKFRRVIVSSFSAGFGGVREMLKDPAAFARIDAIVMADSIYAGYAGDPARRQVDPKNMDGFLRFAREAAAGRKWFVLSHCQLRPDGYASTAETADYLINQLGGKREPTDDAWPAEGLNLESRFRRGHFEAYGFAGTTGADHVRHLHGLWVLLRRVGATD
jgi:hypothetical protein